MYVWVEIQ